MRKSVRRLYTNLPYETPVNDIGHPSRHEITGNIEGIPLVQPASNLALGAAGAIALVDVLQVSILIPGTSTVGVGALVSFELVNEDARVAIQVSRAVTAPGSAGSGRRAVPLGNVLQLTASDSPSAGA